MDLRDMKNGMYTAIHNCKLRHYLVHVEGFLEAYIHCIPLVIAYGVSFGKVISRRVLKLKLIKFNRKAVPGRTTSHSLDVLRE